MDRHGLQPRDDEGIWGLCRFQAFGEGVEAVLAKSSGPARSIGRVGRARTCKHCCASKMLFVPKLPVLLQLAFAQPPEVLYAQF